jgi:pimeloyl-ACP methyl ester carboxylesterase
MVFMDRLRTAVLVLALLAACSGDDGSDGDDVADPTPSTAEAPTTTAAEVEVFAGSVEDFYVVPDPLPEGEPGDLIRTQEVAEADGRVTVRVMYHSQDAQERDRAVTGTITYPTGPAPDGGWPVISTAHGTTGVAGQCALSRGDDEAPGWGVDGVWAMTDYVGQGPVGELHPYLSKPSEGNAVIDIVRAARQIPEAGAGERWVSIGHSQGGHGALSAHELAAERAPELELVGTVALAPAAMLDRVYGGIDPIVTSILTMMATISGATEHPDIDPADYLSPEALAASEVFETGCLDEITEALIPIAIGGAFTADPRETEPAASLVRENDVGEVAVDGVPVYLASGTVDDRVVIDRVRDLYDRMCGAGQVTELTIVEGADHGSILGETADAVTAFVEARLAGEEPTDSCEEQTSDG